MRHWELGAAALRMAFEDNGKVFFTEEFRIWVGAGGCRVRKIHLLSVKPKHPRLSIKRLRA